MDNELEGLAPIDKSVSRYDMTGLNTAQEEQDFLELGARTAWHLWDPHSMYWALERVRDD